MPTRLYKAPCWESRTALRPSYHLRLEASNVDMTDRAENAKSDKMRYTILAAARHLLAAGGIDALTMRGVAQHAGLTATGVYYHFENKDDLVAQIVEDDYRSLGTYLTSAAQGYSEGSLERILAIGEAYVRFGLEHKESFRVLFSLRPRSTGDMHELSSGGGFALLRRCVIEAMEAGALERGNPDLVSHLLWTVAHGLVTLEVARDIREFETELSHVSVSPIDLLRRFERLLINGLGTARAAPEPRPHPKGG